jgi:hypothetical protein
MWVKGIGFEVIFKLYLIRYEDQQWDNRNNQMDMRGPGTWEVSSSVALCLEK